MSGNYLSMIKKRSWRKTLAVAVTAGILAGGYSTALAAEYNQTITGTSADSAYTSIIKPDNVYDFGAGGAAIKPGRKAMSVNIGAGVDNVTLKATGAELLFHSYGGDWRNGTVTLKKDGAGIVNIDAKKTIIQSRHQDEYDGGSRAVVLNGTSADNKAILNVKGDLEVGVYSQGSEMTDTESEEVYGIFAKANSVVNVDGNYSMAPTPDSWGSVNAEETGLHFGYGERTDYSRIAAMFAGTDSQINVKGNVNMTIKGSGLVAKGANSAITVAGGTMKMYDEAGWLGNKYLKNFYIAAAADGGKVNVNMNKDGNASGTNKTDILGDVLTDGAGSVVNIGLNTADSKLSGAIRSENGGTADIYLGNGTWENKVFGNLSEFKGSVVEKLVGGSDAEHKGTILQKDTNKITINNYSGHAQVFYDHTGNGTEAGHYAAGDTLIKNAAEGSGIILSTGNNGIAMDNDAQVNQVLSALAGKLTYEGHANKNLDAKVQIASGLTASSAAAKVENMTFGEDGKGQYGGPQKNDSDFSSSITGIEGTDKDFVSAGIYQDGKYVFSKDSSITANTDAAIEAKNNIAIKADENKLSVNSSGKYGIDNTVAKENAEKPYKIDITAGSLAIKTENSKNSVFGIHAQNNQGSKAAQAMIVVNGDTDINVKGAEQTVGVYASGNSTVEVNGNLVMKGQNSEWGVDNNGTSSMGYHSVNGILADGSYGAEHSGGKIVVNGNVDLSINGTGVLANGNGSSVVINGGGSILTNNSNQDVNYALAAENGSISMNMNAENNTAGVNKVNIKGNIGVLNGLVGDFDTEKGAILNVGLSTADSELHGVAVNGFADSKQKVGGKAQLNMYLSNGALWTNESYNKVNENFTGSKLNKLVGGSDASHAGFILQKDAKPLTIGNYSGHTVIVYEHFNDGTNVDDFVAGDTHIGSAAVGSGVILSTNNEGINVKDKDQVNEVLNNLAGKLYYDAYKNGEKNLKGKVQIASGLTGSSINKDVVGGDMSFKDENGQGQYVAPVTPPAPPVTPPSDKQVFDKQIMDSNTAGQELWDYWGSRNPYVQKGTNRKEVVTGQDIFGNEFREIQYNFSGDTVLNIDSNNDIICSNPTNSQFAAIETATSKTVRMNLNDHSMDINVKGELGGYNNTTNGIKVTGGSLIMEKVGGLNINVSNAKKSYGILVQGDSGYSDGKASMTVDNGDSMDKAVKIRLQNIYNPQAAIFVNNNSGKAALDIKGMVDIETSGDAYGLYLSGGNMNIGGGSITAHDTRAIDAYNGTLTINAKYDKSGNIKAADKELEVDINGNIRSYGKNKTAIGLNTDKSTFTGAIHTADSGKVDMLLSNGALWTNKLATSQSGFTGSKVNQLVGGSDAAHAGFVLQKDTNPLTIGNYSGHTVLVYEHTGDGSEAGHFAAGDTHIKNAAAGSGIVVSTDNTGIDTGNTALVDKVLNNLAGKLYYDAYTTGEKNLNGVVQIASGLTGSSVSKVVDGDMTFNDKTGQGQYGQGTVQPPAPPTKPEHQTEVNFSDAITGDKATDTVFVDAGVLKDNGEYVFEKDSNITLTGANAALDAKKDVVIKAQGSTLNFVTNAGENTAKAIKNEAGKNINITADKTVVKVESTSGRADGIYMSKGDITVNGALDVTAIGNGAQGIYANSGNHTFNGDVKITVDGKGGGWGHYGASGLYATSTMGDSKGSTITVNGMVDISGNGNGIYANAGGSSVTVQGGKIVVNDKDNKGYGAIRAENGVVNMNAKLDEKGNLIAGNGNVVDITGNIVAGTGAVNPSDKNGTKTAINLALDTKESKLYGLILNEFPAEGKPAGGLTFTGETNLVLQNGATWINENVKAEQAGKTLALAGAGAQGSYVTNFVGGKDMAGAGVIIQKDANALTIGNYSGHTYLVYEHSGDGTNATDFVAGDTHIKNAATGSGVTMVTDNINGKIDVNNIDQVSKVLNNLAGKLYYDAFANGENNLTGKVQISSGLTGSSLSQSLASGDIDFGNNSGQGNVVVDTIKPQPKPEPPTPTPDPDKPVVPQLPGNISAGDYETLMMYGARAAMIDSMVAWRDTSAESFVRADELRKGAEDGAWARINRGKIDYSGAGTEIDGNFYGVQAGFDKTFANGWTAGMMFDYRDGDSSYKMGSEGEHKMYGMGFYGTKDLGSNDYIDLAAKFGNAENTFTARNEIGKELKGEYSANAYSLSAQYGKRFEDSNGGYFEPQTQITWSHVDGDNYDARCGSQIMNIDQTAFDSLVGRVGMQAGQISDKGQAYVRLSLAHEFAGDIDGVYLAKDGGLKTTQYNAGDTWSELTVGGNYNLSKCANFYADITKTLTGDYKQDWKFNAGMSFSF